MKTLKIFCSIVAFAITGICSGQLLAQNSNEILYYSSHYNLASNRIEHQLNPYPARTASGDFFEAPLNSAVFFVPVELSNNMESWISRSAESSFFEEDIQLESWMTTPFEGYYIEPDPALEDWMTTPFRTEALIEEEIEVEPWMTAPFK